MSTQPPQARPAAPSGAGRIGIGIALMSVGAAVGFCGLGILAYGGLGAVMVDQSQDDPWVVWSLVIGALVTVLSVIAFVAGVVLMIRRR